MKQVVVSFARAEAYILYIPNKVTVEQMIEAVDQVGFRAGSP